MSAFEIIDEREFKRSVSPSHNVGQRRASDGSPTEGLTDDVEMKLCQWCGSCPDPEHCVWGVQCPECAAPHMQHCTASDGRIVGLHQERWNYARR